MGMKHGMFCLGCCWLFFAILFPIGVMNLVAMGMITVLIFAEKSFSFGRLASRIAAVGLITYGLLAVMMPWLLPAANMQGQPGM